MKAVAECFASFEEEPVIFRLYIDDSKLDSTVNFILRWIQEYCEPVKDRMVSSLTPYVVNLAPKLAICQRPFFISSLQEKQAIHYYRSCNELFVGLRCGK